MSLSSGIKSCFSLIIIKFSFLHRLIRIFWKGLLPWAFLGVRQSMITILPVCKEVWLHLFPMNYLNFYIFIDLKRLIFWVLKKCSHCHHKVVEFLLLLKCSRLALNIHPKIAQIFWPLWNIVRLFRKLSYNDFFW